MKYEREIRVWGLDLGIFTLKEFRRIRALRVEYAVADQFLRSGTSIGANIKEGKASSSRKELIRFYEIALRSAHETEYWIQLIESSYSESTLAFDTNYKQELIEIIKVLSTIILNLKKGKAVTP